MRKLHSALFLLQVHIWTAYARADFTEVAFNGVSWFCEGKGGSFVAGRVSDDGETFTAYSRLARRARNRGTRSAARKFRRKAREGANICEMALITPTPTPQATPAEPSFDEDGNVTAAGKTLFGIPQELEANIDRGAIVFQDKNCLDCHGERRNRTFDNLRTTISEPPMFLDEEDVPDTELADLTAFLNRFR